VNVFIPWIIIYSVYLLWIAMLRFLNTLKLIVSQIPNSLMNVLHFVVWLAVGIPFLLKLWCHDVLLAMRRMTDFRNSSEAELYKISLDDEYRNNLLKVYRNIFEVAKTLKEKRKLAVISLRDMLFELSRGKLQDLHQGGELKRDPIEELQRQETDFDEEHTRSNAIFNKNKYHFERKYWPNSISIYTTILQRFCSSEEKFAKGKGREEVDLGTLIEKLKPNLKPEQVHLLIAYDKPKLEQAWKDIFHEEETEIKSEISTINQKLDTLTKEVSLVSKSILKIESKLFKGPALFQHTFN
jgi:hypothetical protein